MMVMTVAVIMYKKLNISNTDIALYTSWLYLPWVIKPLWSPFVDIFRTKRLWIVLMQLLIGIALAGVALTIPASNFFKHSLAVFWLMAFFSATHDIAADGFYLLGLSESNQAAFIGVRSTFYKIAMIAGQGGLVVLAGALEPVLGIPQAWSVTFYILAAIILLIFLYHHFMLPYPVSDKSTRGKESKNIISEFINTFVLFFRRKDIWIILLFLLLYRFAEAQLVKLVSPFLLDGREKGGLGLSTGEVGIVYGTVGILALTAGGLLGGYVISKKGLRKWLWPMIIIINIPDLVFVYLSYFQPSDFFIINIAIAFEQFGYGFGFTAYTMYMIFVSQGEYKTAHYAICTGIMALGMMLPGMISGKIQELIGYQMFFVWIMISTIPGFIIAALVKIPEGFGMKKEQA